MTGIPKGVLAGLALLLFFGGTTGSTFGSTREEKNDGAYQLVCRQDRLTVKTDRTPLVQLVEEIAAAAGIEIVTASKMDADQLVAADIQDGSVTKVMQALLADYNYLMSFAADAPRQGLHLLSGTTTAASGGKLLVLTAKGDRYQLVEGNPSAGVKAETAGMGARGGPGLSTPAKTTHVLPAGPARGNSAPEYQARRNPADSGRKNLLLPARTHHKKEEKDTMHTGETSFSEGGEAEKKATSLAGDRNYRTVVEEANKSFAGDFDSDAGDIVAGEIEAEEIEAEEPFVREDYLRYQIDKLTARIESGYSDRQFELWSQHRDSKYVTNDRELLAQYEKELREMENKNEI